LLLPTTECCWWSHQYQRLLLMSEGAGGWFLLEG